MGWLVSNLGAIVFLVIGSVLGFFGSWLTTRYSWRMQKADEDRRGAQQEERLWKQCLTDLLGEVEQNQQHQSVDKWLPLEMDAYKRFRHEGLTALLEENLQIELRKLYSHMHEKNNWIHYYESEMTSVPYDERTTVSEPMIAKIDEVHQLITNELFQLKPKLLELLKKPPPLKKQ